MLVTLSPALNDGMFGVFAVYWRWLDISCQVSAVRCSSQQLLVPHCPRTLFPITKGRIVIIVAPWIGRLNEELADRFSRYYRGWPPLWPGARAPFDIHIGIYRSPKGAKKIRSPPFDSLIGMYRSPNGAIKLWSPPFHIYIGTYRSPNGACYYRSPV